MMVRDSQSFAKWRPTYTELLQYFIKNGKCSFASLFSTRGRFQNSGATIRQQLCTRAWNESKVEKILVTGLESLQTSLID